MTEAARAYGYFDAIHGRPSELPDDPGETDSYLEGYAAGMDEISRWSQRETHEDAPGPTISVPMPQLPQREKTGVERNRREVEDGD